METLPTPITATRFDGWTPARQWGFLQALADQGSVSRAAASVGMSTQAAYRLRRHPAADAFRAAWDAAVSDALHRVQEAGIERVLHGEIEVIERGGETIVRHRPCAPQVMVAMLKRCERLADATARAAAARADLVRAEAEAAAAAAARQARFDGVAPEPVVVPAAPLSPETPALAGLHNLLAALPDSQGWEGPEDLDDDDIAVPQLPMPPVTLDPASASLTPRSGRARFFDPAKRAEAAAARAELKAVKAEVARRAAAIARVERRKLYDGFGRSYGDEYG
jgi:hypothetical protein